MTIFGGGYRCSQNSHTPPFWSKKKKRCIDSYYFLCSSLTHFGSFFFIPAHMLCQPHLACVWDVKLFVCPTRMEDIKVKDYVIFIFGFLTVPVTGLARGWKNAFILVVLLSVCLTVVIWEMKANTV